MPSRGDDVFAPGPSAPRDAGKGGSDRCGANSRTAACQQWYGQQAAQQSNQQQQQQNNQHQSSKGQRAREDHAVIVLFARKEAALGQFEGNGDDAFPIDPALAATRAAVAANTNTFGFSTPRRRHHQPAEEHQRV
ncbi:hypothetical protein KC363_g4341 [Hortaea werneckii]|nr:hypothetical protein KC361_g5003 [Hortaea werneckii]KAI6884747.1 hypothetical protein KC325_g4090 [Hortaea werneckii]KAI6994837.1 hypothetical protein KC359_g4418 [Hortaea werneckii]KAI7083338.1 hypothetical protein KC356_g7668 [Hortaea werneckii]KAI7146039.1 hypothetical protein KC344_g4005 [Hortaea werneckii]